MKARKSTTKTRGTAKRAPKDLTPKTSVAGGDAKQTNLVTLQHETRKAVVQNFRA